MLRYIERSGKKISGMTLGTVQLGADYGIANETGMPGRAESFGLLQQAFENGVNSIDTARAYGESEERIGEFLKSHRDHRPYITTKICANASPPNLEAATLPHKSQAGDKNVIQNLGHELEETIFKEAETSLASLAVSKADCIMLHRPGEMMAGGKQLAQIMGKLVAKGYADEVGASVYLPAEAEAMMRYDEYTAVQLPLNLFDQRMLQTGTLQKLADKNYVVFARSVFLQGVFFLDPDRIRDPILKEHAAPHIQTLRRLAGEEGVGVAQLAISFIRDTPGVSSLVLGCETKEQVRENISLMDGPPVSGGAMEAARQVFQGLALDIIMNVLSRPKQ